MAEKFLEASEAVISRMLSEYQDPKVRLVAIG